MIAPSSFGHMRPPGRSGLRRHRIRRGATLLYCTIAMTALVAICSLGVDFGRVQLVKTELQRAADAAARAAVQALPQGVAAAENAAIAVAALNLADNSPVTITATDIEFGTWDSASGTFAALAGAARSSANSVRVQVRRTAAGGNAVPLVLARVVGQNTCNVTTASTAYGAFAGYGLVGMDRITFNGNARTDSYDSSTGPYVAGLAGNQGSLASNGAISLTGNAYIDGDARPGVGRAVSRGGNVVITGSTDPLSATLIYPAVDPGDAAVNNNNAAIPAGFRNGGNFSVSGNNTVTFPAGVYYFNSFRMSGNGRIVIAGEVTIYVNGQIQMTGNMTVQNSRPGNLKIRSLSSAAVSLTGNADMFADVYAPQADVSFTGNAGFYGAVVGRTFTITGNGAMHRDTSLEDPSGGARGIFTVQ